MTQFDKKNVKIVTSFAKQTEIENWKSLQFMTKQ